MKPLGLSRAIPLNLGARVRTCLRAVALAPVPRAFGDSKSARAELSVSITHGDVHRVAKWLDARFAAAAQSHAVTRLIL